MSKFNILLVSLIVLTLLATLSSAQSTLDSFGYDSKNTNVINGNINTSQTFNNNYYNVTQNITNNFTTNLTNYIQFANASILNVSTSNYSNFSNYSTWWANLIGWTSGIFFNNNSYLDLNKTYLVNILGIRNGTDGINGTNGSTGATGASGTNGTNGNSSYIYNITQAVGTNCTNGGVKYIITSNGINTTNFICNGVNGSQGIAGNNGSAGINGTNGTNGINGTNGGTITFINLTSATYNGSLNYTAGIIGYTAGNSICNASFNNSHLCNEFEVTQYGITHNLSAFNDDGWVIAGSPKYAPTDHPVDDCAGFTSSGTASTDSLGNYWKYRVTAGGGKAINCATLIKLSCCTP